MGIARKKLPEDKKVTELLQVVIQAKGKGKAKRRKQMESGDDPMAYGGQPAFQKYEEYARKTGARNTRDRKEEEAKKEAMKYYDSDSDFSDGIPVGSGRKAIPEGDEYDSETEILSGRWMPFNDKNSKSVKVPDEELTPDMTPEQIAAAVRNKAEELEKDEKAEEEAHKAEQA